MSLNGFYSASDSQRLLVYIRRSHFDEFSVFVMAVNILLPLHESFTSEMEEKELKIKRQSMTITCFESVNPQQKCCLWRLAVFTSVTLQKEKTWEPAENTTQGQKVTRYQHRGKMCKFSFIG